MSEQLNWFELKLMLKHATKQAQRDFNTLRTVSFHFQAD